MCEKAKEIQKAWKPKKGDYYSTIVHRKATDIIDIYIDGFSLLPQKFVPSSELYIWLPTQEQLFKEHAKWHRKRYKCKIELSRYLLYVSEFAEIEYFDYTYHSLKEIALGYLFQEKYHKIWNGEDWETA